MAKRFTTEEFIERAKTVHGDRYSYDKVMYVSAHKKVTITCSEHGEFSQVPATHLSGAGCRTCGGIWMLETNYLTVASFKLPFIK